MNSNRLTKGLLICGVASAPLFFTVFFIQAFTRQGYDIRRVPISLLSLGELGWIQITNFLIAGLLTLACSWGVRKALADRKGKTWGPLLIAACGVGLLLAGIFHPDPELGFPPGAPAGLTPPSVQMIIHQSAFFIVVLSTISACFVFLKAFRARGQIGWGRYSATTGIVSLVLLTFGFATETIIAITTMAVISLGWVSAIAGRLCADLKEAG